MKNLKTLVKKWYSKIGISLLVIFSISLNFKQCTDIKIQSQNIKGLSDTLKVTKNKLGEAVKSNGLLLMDINELEENNSSLMLEINKLSKKDKKNLIEINKLSITIDFLKDSLDKKEIIKPDTSIVVDSNTVIYPFSKSSIYRELKWEVTVFSKEKQVTSTITSDKIFADITIGKKEEKNKITLFASSSNPYINITKLEGAVIDLSAYNKFQKKKPFGLGLHIGYGLSTNKGIVFISPYIGVGLSYNFLRW